MKLLHLADLHLGRMLCEQSLIEGGDQPFLVEQILELAERERPQAIVIAGDLYDRANPGNEALRLLDHLLTRLIDLGIHVLITGGEHDAGGNFLFGGELLGRHHLHIAGNGETDGLTVRIEDEWGPVDFRILPHIPDGAYEERLKACLSKINFGEGHRNVLVAHQLVGEAGSPPVKSGTENAIGDVLWDASLLLGFDYAALGHVHKAQYVCHEKIRYAGTPLPLSFAESGEGLGPVVVEIGGDGELLRAENIPLKALHPLRTLTGRLRKLAEEERFNAHSGEYVQVFYEDPQPGAEEIGRLRKALERKGSRLLACHPKRTEKERKLQTLEEAFADFYQRVKGKEISEADEALIDYAAQLIRSETNEEAGGLEADACRLTDFLLDQCSAADGGEV